MIPSTMTALSWNWNKDLLFADEAVKVFWKIRFLTIDQISATLSVLNWETRKIKMFFFK